MISCLPTASELPIGRNGTSGRRRFLGSARTSEGLNRTRPYIGAGLNDRAINTNGDRMLPTRKCDLRKWPGATEVDVSFHVGDWGMGGLVVLSLSFVADDPIRTFDIGPVPV